MAAHQKTAAPLGKNMAFPAYWVRSTELESQKAKAQESAMFKGIKPILINWIWQKSVGDFWGIPVLQ